METNRETLGQPASAKHEIQSHLQHSPGIELAKRIKRCEGLVCSSRGKAAQGLVAPVLVQGCSRPIATWDLTREPVKEQALKSLNDRKPYENGMKTFS